MLNHQAQRYKMAKAAFRRLLPLSYGIHSAAFSKPIACEMILATTERAATFFGSGLALPKWASVLSHWCAKMQRDAPGCGPAPAGWPAKALQSRAGCWLLLAILATFTRPPHLSAQDEKKYLYAGVVSIADPSGNDQNAGAGVYLSGLDVPTWQPVAWAHLPIRALAILEEQQGPVLLLGGDNGILRPFANPPGWKILTDWRVRDVLDLEVDPFRPHIIYAATGMGIVISYDGGASWAIANRGLRDTFVSCLLPDPLRPARIIAGTESGLYESTDYGRSWRSLALNGIAIRAILRQRLSPGVYWVGTEYHGLLASQDGGYVFTPVPLGEDSLSIYCLAGGTVGEPLLAGSFERGLFVASAEDMVWRHLEGSEQLGTVFSMAMFEFGQCLYVGTHGNGVWRSTAAGARWEAFGLAGADVRKLLPAAFAKLP